MNSTMPIFGTRLLLRAMFGLVYVANVTAAKLMLQISGTTITQVVTWAAGVTDVQKQEFVDASTYFCYMKANNFWNGFIQRGAVACYASWDTNTINMQVGTKNWSNLRINCNLQIGNTYQPLAGPTTASISFQFPLTGSCTGWEVE